MHIPLAGGRALIAAASVTVVALSAAARPVSADQVSGQVTLDGRPAAAATLVFRSEQAPQGAIEVQTTDKGTYRVFLQPGRYQVVIKERVGDVQVVESLRAPVTRDLAFGRR